MWNLDRWECGSTSEFGTNRRDGDEDNSGFYFLFFWYKECDLLLGWGVRSTELAQNVSLAQLGFSSPSGDRARNLPETAGVVLRELHLATTFIGLECR